MTLVDQESQGSKRADKRPNQNQFRNRSCSGNNQQSGDRFKSPLHRGSKETGQLHKVGGRLTLFLKEWLMITSDRWVLEVIQKGYAIEFIQNPPTNWGVKCTPVPVNSEARKVLCQEIQNLLEKNVIVPVPVDQVGQGFYSTFFLVQKKTGGYIF